MRPHRLEVTAFGAFAGPVEVSFDALADAGLFLLHGETGAGKTTLLDAIGFALYGRVPGERGKTRRLRSDHASPDVRTEVVFETTIGPRHLRITRNPQQTRPKRHGNGVTTEPARVLLEEERGGHWHAVSTRANEADREIADAMGMSAEQFYQVVLLPQGQFARFLHADAEERRALLQKLFRTDRFRSVEDWLADLRKTTRDRIKDAEQDLSVLTARIEQVAAVPPTPDRPATPAAPAPADPQTPADPAATSEPPATERPATERPATWAGDLAAAAAAEASLAAEAVRAAQSALDAARAPRRTAYASRPAASAAAPPSSPAATNCARPAPSGPHCAANSPPPSAPPPLLNILLMRVDPGRPWPRAATWRTGRASRPLRPVWPPRPAPRSTRPRRPNDASTPASCKPCATWPSRPRPKTPWPSRPTGAPRPVAGTSTKPAGS